LSLADVPWEGADIATVTVPLAEAPTPEDWIVLVELVQEERMRLAVRASEPTGYRELHKLNQLRELERKLNLLSGRFMNV
jgi:hypothetical protein